MHRVSVLGRKGGTGKTTVSVGLASTFAEENMRTLVVDLDPQSNVAFALGVDPTAPGTADLMLGQPANPQAARGNIHVLAGGPSLQEQKVVLLDPIELAEAIEALDYEVVIFDCPPGNESLERFAVVASTEALVVTDAHPLGLLGANRVVESLRDRRERQRRGPERWAMVLSRLDARRAADRNLPQAVEDMHPALPQLRLSQDTSIAEATATQLPIAEACPGSRGTQDLREIRDWVLNG